MSHGAELADAQSMKDKRYSGGSNETDLREGSCDWSTLIMHSGNSTPWDIGKHILAERNRRNEATTNHKRSVNSALCQFCIMGSHLKSQITRSGIGLRNTECVIEATNQRYSALFHANLCAMFI